MISEIRTGKALLLLLLFLTACDAGIRQMGSTEYGLKFRKLPPLLGGGVANQVILPGQVVLVWPWDSVYRFDTSVKYVSWGAKVEAGEQNRAEYISTRALDGNEVALAVTVQYKISTDADKLKKLVTEVATSNEDVLDIVDAVARADVRTKMNELKTSAFFVRDARYGAIEKAKERMQERLAPWGIEIQSVILKEHRFERLLPDGSVDTSYQQKINETQKLREDTERERLRIATVKASKQQEFNDVQASVNRVKAEADGKLNQAMSKGDSYFQAKSNEAKAIMARGEGEVKGMLAKISALSGSGGRAILKLELAKELSKTNPSFVILGDNNSSSDLAVQKIDTNELLRQIGIGDAIKDKDKERDK